YLSFDIDSIDPGFAPGTGSPEPGGLLPREALEIVRVIAKEGLCAMEVVEIAPPYDVNDNTAQLGCRVILDALGSMVAAGKLGHRDKVMNAERVTEVSTVRARAKGAKKKSPKRKR
ncbi:MAG: arginase family protein, partial [Dongiaceae bacterium]